MKNSDRFYKYVSCEVAKIILSDFTLKYTDPVDFNDPFDYNPAAPKQGLSKFRKHLNKEYGSNITNNDVKKNLHFLTSTPFRRIVADNLSVTCFSKSPYIVPMWAHYANNHSGCVLEFYYPSLENCEKYSENIPNRDMDILLPLEVTYSNDRPVLFDSNGRTNSDRTGFMSCLIKSDEWEYEQELRAVVFNKSGIYPFDKTQLCSIRFGLRTQDSDKREIYSIIKKINAAHDLHMKMYNMAMHHDEYKLVDVNC